MNIKLYYFPNTCALVPFAALIEANVEFDVEVVNLRKREQHGDAFLSITRKHAVPVLAIGEDRLTENVAILEWIADQFADAALLPSGFDRYRSISLMAWFASGVHPPLSAYQASPQGLCARQRLAAIVKTSAMPRV